jgi:molecular chaperone DnaK
LADPNTRQGKRTPVTLKIKFKSETLEQFIERYAVDVSQGGIFIRTKEPLAVGTQMKFEFQLRDASPLIAGEGTVVWTRENDPSRPAIAPGMGVRFDRLADGSQTVLEKILSEKAKQAPSRGTGETAPGQNKPMFGEETTKVAPAMVQEALGVQTRGRMESEQTPLPKPMPSTRKPSRRRPRSARSTISRCNRSTTTIKMTARVSTTIPSNKPSSCRPTSWRFAVA